MSSTFRNFLYILQKKLTLRFANVILYVKGGVFMEKLRELRKEKGISLKELGSVVNE